MLLLDDEDPALQCQLPHLLHVHLLVQPGEEQPLLLVLELQRQSAVVQEAQLCSRKMQP